MEKEALFILFLVKKAEMTQGSVTVSESIWSYYKTKELEIIQLLYLYQIIAKLH